MHNVDASLSSYQLNSLYVHLFQAPWTCMWEPRITPTWWSSFFLEISLPVPIMLTRIHVSSALIKPVRMITATWCSSLWRRLMKTSYLNTKWWRLLKHAFCSDAKWHGLKVSPWMIPSASIGRMPEWPSLLSGFDCTCLPCPPGSLGAKKMPPPVSAVNPLHRELLCCQAAALEAVYLLDLLYRWRYPVREMMSKELCRQTVASSPLAWAVITLHCARAKSSCLMWNLSELVWMWGDCFIGSMLSPFCPLNDACSKLYAIHVCIALLAPYNVIAILQFAI